MRDDDLLLAKVMIGFALIGAALCLRPYLLHPLEVVCGTLNQKIC